MSCWNEFNQQFIFNYVAVFPVCLVSRTCLAIEPLKGLRRTQVKNHCTNQMIRNASTSRFVSKVTMKSGIERGWELLHCKSNINPCATSLQSFNAKFHFDFIWSSLEMRWQQNRNHEGSHLQRGSPTKIFAPLQNSITNWRWCFNGSINCYTHFGNAEMWADLLKKEV